MMTQDKLGKLGFWADRHDRPDISAWVDEKLQELYYDLAYIEYMHFEDEWYKDSGKRREAIAAMKAEADPEWVRERRMEYLEYKIKELSSDIEKKETEIAEMVEMTKKFLGENYVSCVYGVFGNEYKLLKRKFKSAYIEYATLRGELKIQDGKFSDDIVEKCRHVPVETFLDGRIFNAGRGRKRCLCPFHSERTPSFFIFQDNSFHCFGCGALGQNAVDFIMKKMNMNFYEAVNYLKDLA